MKESNKESTPEWNLLILVLVTLIYWFWEIRAEGNIRVDLVLIYPLLFVFYIKALWKRFKWYSLLFSSLIMLLNFGFLILSYDLFDKYPG
ncbi:hypothetical protein [Methylophaga sp.]|uniref:hypothetical protein n=1 Tax=Methylophaga sp. TaxID=2024840 RepID=UPI003A902D6C